MIRVHFAEREPEDVPANQSQVGAAGELVLCEAETETYWVQDPMPHQQTRIRATTWVRTYGPKIDWLYCEPVHEDDAESAPDPERQLQEVFP